MAIRFYCPRRARQCDRCPARVTFSCLTRDQDAALGRERLARHYEARQVILYHDTPALAVLSVHSGQVRLTRWAKNGHETTVGLRGPGELLGVREVLSGMPYQVSAQTVVPSVICAVPREAFLAAVRGCSELAMRLLGGLSRDYLLAEEQLVARAELSVTARTARLLLALSDAPSGTGARGTGRRVSMNREEMAHLVGTTRESLSRALHRLEAKRLVDLAGNGTILLQAPAALEELAHSTH